MTRWVKICGPTSAAGVALLARSGCDAIGLNLAPGSRRCLTRAQVRDFVALARTEAPAVEIVLVTVNYGTSVASYAQLLAESGASTVQLHGEETPELVAGLCASGLNVIKAVGLAPGMGPKEAVAFVAPFRQLSRARLLVDARTQTMHGGTGRRLNPSIVRALAAHGPLILAGGLGPANISTVLSADIDGAIVGVDCASGVEGEGGTKDADLVAAFMHNVRRVDTRLGGAKPS